MIIRTFSLIKKQYMKSQTLQSHKKAIKFEFEDTDSLKKLIDSVYFSEGNQGKLNINLNTEKLDLPNTNLYYDILQGLTHKVKLKNSDIINGSMELEIIESDDNIELSPLSKYCIVESGKYSFY